jgi:hypothetical protein
MPLRAILAVALSLPLDDLGTCFQRVCPELYGSAGDLFQHALSQSVVYFPKRDSPDSGHLLDNAP